jgi:hypothetical protein
MDDKSHIGFVDAYKKSMMDSCFYLSMLSLPIPKAIVAQII